MSDDLAVPTSVVVLEVYEYVALSQSCCNTHEINNNVDVWTRVEGSLHGSVISRKES